MEVDKASDIYFDGLCTLLKILKKFKKEKITPRLSIALSTLKCSMLFNSSESVKK